MGKKHFTHGRLKVFMTIILAVILIVLVVVCAKKIKLAQNEKNIIGTWKNSSSENVITVQDSEALILYNDIPEAGLYHASYFDPGTKLIYAIGAVVGLIGGIKVYGKFSSGDPDTSKTAASWFGACIFLIVSATILRSFFL